MIRNHLRTQTRHTGEDGTAASPPGSKRPKPATNPRWLSACAIVLPVFLLMLGCRSGDSLPKPGSERYQHFISSFYVGLAGLQVGDDVRAETGLAEAAVFAPGEPAAWVDWGILALRQRNYDAAAARLTHAHSLAPGDDQIDYLQGLLESSRGNSAAAIADLQAAVAANGRNVRALYQLAAETERQGDAGSDLRYQQLLQQILAVTPSNLAAQLDLCRIAAKRGDTATLKTTLAGLSVRSKAWPAEVTQQLAQLQTAADSAQPRVAATRAVFLRNVLMRVPEFRDSLVDLVPAPGEGAQPMTHFLRLPNPPSRPAVADTGLTFQAETPPPNGPAGPWSWAGALLLNGDDLPVLTLANATQLHLADGVTLPFPSGPSAQPLTPEGVLPIDFNYDFKTDLVLAGAGGVRLFRQDAPAKFTDVTTATRLPSAILNASYTAAWALDIEADGDLDILLGSPTGLPTLLRNNGDSTFAVTHPFAGLSGARQLTWADLNGDGNPDAAILDGDHRLHLFLNQRSGAFTEAPVPQSLGPVKAIAIADLGTGDTLDLVAVQANGEVVRLSTPDQGRTWRAISLLRLQNPALLTGELRLLAEDLDNNGAVDLVLTPVGPQPAASPAIWLQSDHGTFDPLPTALPVQRVFALSDLTGDGHLALVGLTSTGAPATATTHGTKDYHWQIIRPRARQATGDQRINSFGIGGEIEVRSGLLLQKQPIQSPALHFGLGEQKQTDVARILWPNGSVRAEFALKANQQIVTEQRLKGSCPFLFGWNGQRFGFVKDSVPWGSAIGLRINALGSANIAATEEWYKIPREQLQPRNGFYDLRITGELWETYYYDSMALMTVDHPAGTEVYTDERYDVPAVKLAVTPTAAPQPLLRATDDNGWDATATLAHLDGVYLDTFGRGQYQGITRDHSVELTLPGSASTQAPLWLIAKGWLHPADSSINIALSQGAAEKPHWLSLEVAEIHGGWRVVRPNLGFPAGRNKICLLDLTGIFRPGDDPRHLRLRTNLEVYWDQIQWAQGLPSTPMKIQRLQPSTADLHYRGFSTIQQANASSPEIPDYNHLAGTSPRWRDLEGYYTRFGDVRELLDGIDDRYVIMNAGDEMSLRFPVPPPPPPGWVRDFVLAGDGWIKDGDYNSSHSRTVLPYPYHARRDYDAPPAALQDDWVYRHHPQDWQDYQTRYVTPAGFVHALRGFAAQ